MVTFELLRQEEQTVEFLRLQPSHPGTNKATIHSLIIQIQMQTQVQIGGKELFPFQPIRTLPATKESDPPPKTDKFQTAL